MAENNATVPQAVKTIVLTGEGGGDAPAPHASPAATVPDADPDTGTASAAGDDEETLQLENVKQLRARCRALDLNAAGRKSELIARLMSSSRSS